MAKKRDYKQARKSERKLNEATVDSAQESATGTPKKKRTTATGDAFVRRKLKEIYPDAQTRKFFEQLGSSDEQGPDVVYRVAMTQAKYLADALRDHISAADPTEIVKEIRDASTVINRLLTLALSASKLQAEMNLGTHPDRITVAWEPWPDWDPQTSTGDVN